MFKTWHHIDIKADVSVVFTFNTDSLFPKSAWFWGLHKWLFCHTGSNTTLSYNESDLVGCRGGISSSPSHRGHRAAAPAESPSVQSSQNDTPGVHDNTQGKQMYFIPQLQSHIDMSKLETVPAFIPKRQTTEIIFGRRWYKNTFAFDTHAYFMQIVYTWLHVWRQIMSSSDNNSLVS